MTETLSQIVDEFVKKVKGIIEKSRGSDWEWDINRMEEALRGALKSLGKDTMKFMIQKKVEDAEGQVQKCKCDRKIPRHKKEMICIYTTCGAIQVDSVYHYCDKCKRGDNPIKRLTGIRGKWRSRLLEKALRGFWVGGVFFQGAGKIPRALWILY